MDILKKSIEFAKQEYAKHEKQHQWDHVKEVMTIALKLARSYPKVDLEILKLAVIFHDVSYSQYETHVEDSIKVAERFLRAQNYAEEKIKKVLAVMMAHSGPHRRKYGETNLIEGKIIHDADKFRAAQSPESVKKYLERFYLDETRALLRKVHPELF